MNTSYLNMSIEQLEELKSFNTAKEISHQPEMWKKAVLNYEKESVKKYFKDINLNDEFDIIFTGAGTSEYVGNILEPLLNNLQNLNFRSVATTDIVNNPLNYLKKSKKTLLVSFARSGDSPESVATVDLANELINEVYHLFITCNDNGELAKRSRMEENKKNTLMLLMPEGTNDKGFAMTSSFSCMLLTAILAFYNIEDKNILSIIDIAEKELSNKIEKMKEIADLDHERIIILGDGPLKGLAQEIALKIMELSAGKSVSKNDTTLGFRHGPKAIINDKTIVFELVSPDKYAKKYDKAIIEEIYSEKVVNKLVAFSLEKDEEITKNTDFNIYVEENTSEVDEMILSIFTYLVYGQMYAFFKSQHEGLTTDNPFPTGEVNRVVKKFEIHKF